MALLPESVHIWRDTAGTHWIEWQTSDPETVVRASPLTGEGSWEPPAAPGQAGRIMGLEPGRRHEFELSDDRGTRVHSAERVLGLEGCSNFRDAGGYPARDGQRMRWGALYRSGNLAGLTEADMQRIAGLDIGLICDFRRPDEQALEPSRLPEAAPAPEIVSFAITPGSQASALYGWQGSIDSRRAMFDFMVEINREFVRSQSHLFAELFERLLLQEEGAVLVHCSAGKDRTGFAVAMIQAALGVDESWQRRDYLLSRRYFYADRELPRVRRKYQIDHLPDEAIMPMLSVEGAYLDAAMQCIAEEYGTVDSYLERALGVGPAEREVLRRRYLEPAR